MPGTRLTTAAATTLLSLLGIGLGVGCVTPAAPTAGPASSAPAVAPEPTPAASDRDRAGAAGTTRVAVLGDTGTGSADQVRTADSVAAAGPFDALLLLGDLVYPLGDPDLVDEVVTTPYSAVVEDGATLVPVLGNHDHDGGAAEEILARLGRSSGWYVEQVGAVRLVVLDTERVDDPEQTRWLEQTLAAPAPEGSWTVVAMHRPAYSSGLHGSAVDVREAWEPLLTRYDVPLVLAGHDHDYERSVPQDGVVHVVSGAGASTRPVGREAFTAVSASVLHHLELEVSGARLTGRAVGVDGELVDEFVLTR